MSDESYVLVRDEEGRRRFHGAFTGGFSAGYYNTVGSKEGWAPSEFVSSRDKRSERKIARPEDFMDEEDKQMLSDSARLVATDDFDTIGSTQRDLEKKRATARNMQATGGVLGALPDTLIDDIVVPSSEPVGIRLLKRMGWKPGQGIGPRVSRRQRKPEDGLLSDDDEVPANVTFAPIDSAVVVFTHKSNHQGLGFDPYKNAPEFDKSMQSGTSSKYLSESFQSKKTGFGFGTFDDDDEEDDVYGSGPTPLRLLDRATVLNDDRPYSRRKENKDVSEPQPEPMVPLYCSDGRPPLRGFVLAATPAKPMVWYSAPKVPRDFVPYHTFDDNVRPVLPRKGREQPKLTSDDRALVLGETPIDAPRRSVFEYMSAENKHRLDNVLGFVMDTEGDKRLRKDYWEVPKIEKSAAEAALKGFMPFGDNIPKQNRYKQFLNVQAGISDEKIELVEGFRGEDMTKELNEFVQAARIFKPLTSTMANRFTSASKAVEVTQPSVGLRSAEDIKAARRTAPMHVFVEKMEVPKSQAAKAAAMGMFGPLTRTIVDFYPSKLLCKRFNVPNPHPDHKESGREAAKDLLDKDTLDRMMISRKPGEGITSEDSISKSRKESASADAQEDVGTEAVVEEETSKEAEVIQERPPMDIFKAIFDNSDSDSDLDSDTQAEDDKKTPRPGQRATDKQRDASMSDTEEGKEGTPQGVFRPIFTRLSERSETHSSATTSRVQPRSSKLDLSHLNEEEGDDENEMGPKFAIPKSKSTSSSSKRQVNNAPTSTGARTISSANTSLPTRERSPSTDEFIGPVPPTTEKRTKDDSGSEQEHLKEGTSLSSLRHEESRSSKRHKSSSSSSRYKSSSSRSDRNDSHSNSSHFQRRSKNRDPGESKQDDSETDWSDADKDGRDRKRHSRHLSSSKTKSSKRHRKHRSRSRSRSPSSRSHKKYRDKNEDRDRDRERSSKRSRSEKHVSKHRDRRERDKADESMDELWVEKEWR
ncbi:hypothetical protein BGZ54_006204 [Gamsiella multidivaricata]|nr:hypothetical protein BGZ54_006204 [Gamsiella multidivaricata]